MTLEALLAYAHILAFLTMVVFLTSEAALCRPEWMSPAIVERLARVDRIYGIAAPFEDSHSNCARQRMGRCDHALLTPNCRGRKSPGWRCSQNRNEAEPE